MAASRQQEPGSRARDTTTCVTRYKNGEKCEVCIFRCYGTQSRAASNRRTVNSKSSLPELALLLSARSPVSPAAFLFAKNGERCEMRVFRCYGTRSRAASSRRNTHRQVGSARARTLACNPIACRPRRFSPPVAVPDGPSRRPRSIALSLIYKCCYFMS